ncbi:MAG: hypothetical protein LBF22_12985 [Deltaproteobacteria bacterium]|jgi:branched-subunit amino acid aminotransferase/4-amino-4-deoxychorismate lyase|nr:hypothetical protein [Deltaproteobacteria bacterium]
MATQGASSYIQPVFVENIKVFNGNFINLEDHAIRMDRTKRHFFREPFIHHTLSSLLPSPPSGGLYKCTLVYDRTIHSVDITPFTIPKIKSASLAEVKRLDLIYKTQDRSNVQNLLSSFNTDEIIMVFNSFITNASSYNLVFQDEQGALLTPLHYLHSGTKREYYLKKKEITTFPIKPQHIKYYTKVFFINALVDITDDVSLPCHEILPIDPCHPIP